MEVHELRPEDAPAFLDRWDDFHDAVVQAITFELSEQSATIKLQAQDKTAEWAWRDVIVVIDALSEFTCRQPPNYDVRVIFEAGLCWDEDVVLFALDAPSEQNADAFRASDTYFGGQRLRWQSAPPL
jgi:hypothetical protein